YVYRDPHAPIPTLRRLASQGVAAEGMHPSNPAITWPNHTTLVTGVRPAKHSVIFNGLFVRDGQGKPARIDMTRNQSELIATPTIWDICHAAGFSTAAVNWPCTRGSSTLDDCLPDCPNPFDHTTRELRKELIEADIMPSTRTTF